MWVTGVYISVLFQSLGEHRFDRGAYRFVGTMNTSDPAARAALPCLKFCNKPLGMFLPRLFTLYGDNPAYPFIAGERRKALPRW